MSEYDLNYKIIKDKYKKPSFDAMVELYSEGYKNGLAQGRFDKKMMEIENEHLQKKLNKAIELLIKENLPCDIEEFNIRNADYCSSNCSVDEEVFKKCWLKYIEQELENDNR